VERVAQEPDRGQPEGSPHSQSTVIEPVESQDDADDHDPRQVVGIVVDSCALQSLQDDRCSSGRVDFVLPFVKGLDRRDVHVPVVLQEGQRRHDYHEDADPAQEAAIASRGVHDGDEQEVVQDNLEEVPPATSRFADGTVTKVGKDHGPEDAEDTSADRVLRQRPGRELTDHGGRSDRQAARDDG